MGGGGGGSGRVGYAGYIETAHELIIRGTEGSDTFANSLIVSLTATLTDNPYTGQGAFNPDTTLALMRVAVAAFKDISDDLIDDTVIAASVATFDEEATARLENEVIPKFNTLMRDICAVQSSSFVIGRANLLAAKSRDVNKYESELTLTWKKLYMESQSAVMINTLEIGRMEIAASHDEEQRDSEIEALEANWRIDTLVKGGQFLGILGGGSMIPTGASKAQSAVAGGLAGAAAGAYVGTAVGGPGLGTGVGAAIGGVVGAGAAFL